MAVVAFAHHRSVNSIPGYLSAIQKLSDDLGYGKLPRGIALDQTIKGLRNYFGGHDVVKPKVALSIEDLLAIRERLNMQHFESARVWCAITLAYFALLRVGEYADGALRLDCIRVSDAGIILTIPFSKTTRHEVEVRVARRDDILCPVLALQDYLSFLPTTRSKTASLFVSSRSSSTAWSRAAFATALKSCVKLIGKDPRDFAGHSLRRGGCTALFLAGVSEAWICAHGRWRSLAYRRYLDFVHDTAWEPTRLLAAFKGRPLPSREEAAALHGVQRLKGSGRPAQRV